MSILSCGGYFVNISKKQSRTTFVKLFDNEPMVQVMTFEDLFFIF